MKWGMRPVCYKKGIFCFHEKNDDDFAGLSDVVEKTKEQTRPNIFLFQLNTAVELYKEGTLDFSKVKTFNLDEYCDLDVADKNSYHTFMFENLFSHINVSKENIHIPDGESKDANKECKDYEKAIVEAGGIDLQVLGIGRNGHIGFNEPDASLFVETHVTDLTQTTIDDNARFFEKKQDVPTKVITMGMGTIMNARKIIVLANGEGKKDAIRALLSGKVTTNVPVSLLQLHPNVVLICDEAAYPND